MYTSKMVKFDVQREYDKILHAVENEMGLGSDTTYLTQLDTICRKLFGSKYMGTFPSDRLPKLTLSKPYAIANLDRYGMPGSHWIALAKDAKRTGVYDSFGRATIDIIPSLLKSKRGRVVDSKNDPEQADSEANCGQRCVAWLIFVDKYGLDRALQI